MEPYVSMSSAGNFNQAGIRIVCAVLSCGFMEEIGRCLSFSSSQDKRKNHIKFLYGNGGWYSNNNAVTQVHYYTRHFCAKSNIFSYLQKCVLHPHKMYMYQLPSNLEDIYCTRILFC